MLSVIIPVYNVEKYIRACLDSVIRQKTDDLEIIIVNDGSTDQSEEICMEYLKLYPDIRYKKQENAGLGDARNAGLAYAKGEYIIFLDSDDCWREDLIECVLDCLHENPNLDILYFDSDVIYEDEKTVRNNCYDARMYHRETSVKDRIYKGPEFFLYTYPLHFNVSACMAVYRKEFLTKHHIVFPEKIFYEDNLFSIKAALKADWVRYLPERLYRRRYRANSIVTSAIDEKHIRDYIQVVRLMAEFIHFEALLGDIRKEQMIGQELLCRKIKDVLFLLIQKFYEMCSLYRGKKDIIWSFKEEIYCNMYQIAKSKQTEEFNLEELEAFLYLGIQLEEDTRSGLTDEMIISEKASFGEAFWCPEFDKNIWKIFFNDCRCMYQKKAKRKLKDSGIFAWDRKTGIYGGGNHTRGLLKAAKQYGKLPEDLFLLDSYAVSGEQEFDGLPVINIRDIPADTDQIIISSFLYEQELYENAQKYAKEHVKINRLYQNEVRELCWQFIDSHNRLDTPLGQS